MSVEFGGNESQPIIRTVRPYWEFQRKAANAGQCCGGFAMAIFSARKQMERIVFIYDTNFRMN